MTPVRASGPSAARVPWPTAADTVGGLLDAGRPHLVVLLGGPGTGRTRIARGVVAADPAARLMLVRSRAVAVDAATALTATAPRAVRRPPVMSFHSFAYRTLGAAAVALGCPPPRLVQGGVADAELRAFLAGDVLDGRTDIWPEDYRTALSSPDFAGQIRDFGLRLREMGLGPADLESDGRRLGEPLWLAVADVLRRWAQARALMNERFDLDAADLGRTALEHMVREPALTSEVWGGERVVAVDDLHDCDAVAWDLVDALRGTRPVLVTLDPSQAVFGYRGGIADVLGEAERRWPASAAVTWVTLEPAQGPGAAAATGLVARLGAGTHRVAPRVVSGAPAGTPTGDASAGDPSGDPQRHAVPAVVTSSDLDAVAWRVAGWLHRRLAEGVPADRCAVLLRSGPQVELWSRLLARTSLPVRPLDRTVVPGARGLARGLVQALRYGLVPTAAAALEVAAGPLVGLGPGPRADLRRAEGFDDWATGGDTALPSALFAGADGRLVVRLERILRAARAAAAASGADAAPAAAVSAVWVATGLEAGLVERALAGEDADAVAAHAELDRVMQLVDRADDQGRRYGAGLQEFLDIIAGLRLGAEPVMQRGERPPAIWLGTVHAACDLRFDAVVVAGVDDGVWPAPAAPETLLGLERFLAARRGDGGVVDGRLARTAHIAVERRLLYRAMHRAEQHLLVAGALGEDGSGSPFLRELPAAEVLDPAVGRILDVDDSAGWSTRVGMLDEQSRVGLARRALVAGHAGGLDELVAAAGRGVPGADPATWWGVPLGGEPAAPDAAAVGETDVGERRAGDAEGAEGAGMAVSVEVTPIRLSPSRVDDLERCPLRAVSLRWGPAGPVEPPQVIGNAVHDVTAQFSQDGRFDEEARAAAVAAAGALVAAQFPDGGWLVDRAREQARVATDRALGWAEARQDLFLGAEAPFSVPLGEVAGRPVRIEGRADRVERVDGLPDGEQALRVWDLKTGAKRGSAADNPQLLAYQVAVAAGAFDGLLDRTPETGVRAGGAGLVFVAGPDPAKPAAILDQAPLDDDALDEARRRLLAAAGALVGPPAARPSDLCRNCRARTVCPTTREGGAGQ